MFCKKCGNTINENSLFCSYCGEGVVNENTSTTNKNKKTKNNVFFTLNNFSKLYYFLSVFIIIILGITTAFYFNNNSELEKEKNDLISRNTNLTIEFDKKSRELDDVNKTLSSDLQTLAGASSILGEYADKLLKNTTDLDNLRAKENNFYRNNCLFYDVDMATSVVQNFDDEYSNITDDFKETLLLIYDDGDNTFSN